MRQPLGQHFLRDLQVVETILQAAELQPTDTVLEIGPGKGVLTEPLSKRVKNLIAVELDRTLAPKLQQRFAAFPHVRIIQADFLKVDLNDVIPAKAGIQSNAVLDPGFRRGDEIKILGNLPYSITAPIFEKILAWPGWRTGVFLIQREVGERMRSAPGSKVFGVLSLAVQLFATIESICIVKPGAFVPPPEVTSMVVRLRRRSTLPVPDEAIADFFDLAHAAFSHRRKTLVNSLALFSQLPKKNIELWLKKYAVTASARAESLGLEEYARLAAPWGILRRETQLT